MVIHGKIIADNSTAFLPKDSVYTVTICKKLARQANASFDEAHRKQNNFIISHQAHKLREPKAIERTGPPLKEYSLGWLKDRAFLLYAEV